MTSKYDRHWAACLDQIQAALGRAAGGSPAAVATPGLRDLGTRQSWYGLAEVRGSELIRSSMAHATSLGKTVAGSEICAPWPQDTFRLTVSTAGDTVTITTASQAARTTPHRRLRRAPATPAGERPPAPAVRSGPAPAQGTAGRAGPEEFYQLLAELAGGARRLRDCQAGDCPSRWGLLLLRRRRGPQRRQQPRGPGRHARADRCQQRDLVGPAPAAPRAPGRPRSRQRQPPGLVFRRHVGAALIRRDGQPPGLLASWLDRRGPHPGWARQETAVEIAVSRHIGAHARTVADRPGPRHPR